MNRVLLLRERVERLLFGMTRAERRQADEILEERRERSRAFLAKHLKPPYQHFAMRRDLHDAYEALYSVEANVCPECWKRFTDDCPTIMIKADEFMKRRDGVKD